MKHIAATLALVALGAAGLSAPAEAKSKTAKVSQKAVSQKALAGQTSLAAASGTPQRSSTLPPGLAKLLLDPNNGITRALIATEGSNSRLQDSPSSP